MGDPILQGTIKAVATQINETIFKYVKRHAGYMFSYKGNIKKLQDEIKELRGERDRIQGKVDRAKNSAQVIENNVLLWLTDVQTKEQEVDDFLADEIKENKQCFKCMYPNLIWRHRLGKGADEKTTTVVDLKERGGIIESLGVSHHAPFPTEMLVTSSEDYMHFQSRDLIFSKILDALKDSNVKMILVHGPGGVGKTRMVKEVTKQVNKWEQYEVVEATISKDLDVKDVQDQLAAQLNLKFDSDGVLSRKAQLYNRLKDAKEKVLVIMDDVWKKEDMDEIGVPFTYCKILVTSRHKGLCERKPDQKEFSIGVLDEMEAWELFRKIVGDISVDESTAKQVCKECGGLPVVILAIGGTLKSKETHVWKDALNKLKSSNMLEIPDIDPKIYASLKLSYDNLKPAQKSLFLLFCLFPEDVEVAVDDLVRYSMALELLSDVETLEEARYSVHASVDALKSSHLLLYGKNKYFAKMHDIIRDVAIYITKRKEFQREHGISMWPERQQFLVKHDIRKWPKKGTWEFSSAISLRSSNINVELPNDVFCPKLHTLILELGMLKVPQRFFVGMEKVTVLVLIKMSMLSLPPSLANLVNLRMLFLNRCELEDMNVLRNLKDSIEILSLKGSKIEMLPSEIGQLTCLRLLDLQNVWPLEVIPKGVFSKLLNLEELYVPKNFKIWGCINPEDEKEFNASQITTLHIHVPNVEVLHKNFPLERLTGFRILVGDDVDYDYLLSDDVSSRKVLQISSVDIKDELKILLERTEELYLEKLEGLKCLDHLMGEPKCSVRSFSELTKLCIWNCGFKYLFSPSCARSLQQLLVLRITGCKNLEQVIGIEGEKDEEEIQINITFRHLKFMVMEELPKLVSFYGKLRTKTIIAASSSSRAQSLFDDQVALPTLEILSVRQLPNITSIWEQKPSLTLEVLNIWSCENLEFIIATNSGGTKANNDNIIRFRRLRLLRLRNIESLKGFCDNSRSSEYQPLFDCQVSFPLLKELYIIGLRNITKIWEVEGMTLLPSQLRSLHIQDCSKLEVIISIPEKEKEAISSNNDIITISALGKLNLEILPNFKKFYSSMPESQYLLNHQVSFPRLYCLYIRKLGNIIKVWEVEDMILFPCQLKVLSIQDCPKLEVIISVPEREKEATSSNNGVITCSTLGTLFLMELPNFKKFYSSMVEGQYLLNHQVSLPILSCLHICGLRNIIKIWEVDSVALLPCQLKELIIKDCLELEVIILVPEREREATASNNDIFTFSPLERLRLDNLPNFKKFYSSMPEGQYLFNHQVEFPHLELLDIRDMENIEEVWSDTLPTNSFGQLTYVRISKCNKLTGLASSKLLAMLQSLQLFEIKRCESLQVIFKNDGWNTADIEITDAAEKGGKIAVEFMFPPQLKTLEFQELPSFQSFFSETPCFQLPSTVELIVENCPKWRHVPNC